jgi:hypothetical protein
MKLIGESAIQARDFAGFVPASRGAHCRPLHPRLASFYLPEKNGITDPRLDRRPGLKRSDLDCARSLTSLRQPLFRAADRRAWSRKIDIGMLQCATPITFWRTFRGGVAVI